ncbi:uncharacterized protein BJ171DRAFT_617489 [Polychytrium aggregatum]|uniref:uncharacterized protein n=1 Tax=Polychytrium aggregatum TaxID=110093 RepID=UPI0022FE7969|nr:uncharacterized protein BJ171DRAFT_617489 [Polychytrium aggregatum]KAI9190544.1 hypothetical protein BJ171DRAFT_617489 [Polychytrium aggregatum]
MSTVLPHDDAPIPGQRFACISMVSPLNPRNKCSIQAFKLRGVTDTLDDAKSLAHAIRNTDPSFDVFVMPVGRWVPWVDNPLEVPDVNYVQSQLTELINEHKKHVKESTKAFNEHIEALKSTTGPIPVPPEKETVSLWFDIKRLASVLEYRQRELEGMIERYNEMPDEERKHAESLPLPAFEIAPFKPPAFEAPPEDNGAHDQVIDGKGKGKATVHAN